MRAQREEEVSRRPTLRIPVARPEEAAARSDAANDLNEATRIRQAVRRVREPEIALQPLPPPAPGPPAPRVIDPIGSDDFPTGRTSRAGEGSSSAGREGAIAEPHSGPVVPIVGVRFQRIALVVVVLLAFLTAAWVASELLAGLLLGVLTAFAIEPAHRRLLRYFPRRRALVAGVTVSALALGSVAICSAIFYLVGDELVTGLGMLKDGNFSEFSPTTTRALERFGITSHMISDSVARLSERTAELASALVSTIVGSAFHVFAGALIAFLTAFYTLTDRQPIERRLAQLLPLHPRTTRELIEEFRKVGRGTLVGSVIAGLVQGVFAAIGHAIADVPRALLLGVLTAAASLVPVFGTLLVWVPVGAILILTGHPVAGIFELVWSVIVTTGLVDYVIRPRIAGAECRSHPLLFLIGLIGGVEVFGGVGIIAGPLVMTFFASALRIYRREIVEPARREAQSP